MRNITIKLLGMALMGCLPLVLGVGCASSHTIQYKLSKTDTWKDQSVAGVLRVMTLVDQTTPIPSMTVEEPPYVYRLNYREGYKDKEIATGVTEMLIEHLRKSGLFKDVVGQNSPRPAEMELSGVIADYSTRCRINKGAEVTSATFQWIGIIFIPIGPIVFNAIGNGVTSGEKTEIQAAVTLRDMSLKSVSSTNVLWHNTINVNTSFVGHWANATPFCVFQHPDNCLRTAVNEMIQQIGTALKAGSP